MAVGAAGGPSPESGLDRHREALRFFRRRNLRALAIVAAVALVFWGCSTFTNFDLGFAIYATPLAFQWMFENFMPTAASLSELPYVLQQTLSTALSSVAATMVSALFSVVLAVMGSQVAGVRSRVVRTAIRVFASVFRNIPMVAWALLLLLSFKQNEFTGFLALFLTTFGQLTRLFLDTFDEIPTGPVEALRSCGASYWQTVFQGALPLAVAQLMSWVLYMVETNIRSATLIGILTGTGIGFAFDLFYKSFRYDEAGLVIVVTIVVVIAIEMVSNRARRSMI